MKNTGIKYIQKNFTPIDQDNPYYYLWHGEMEWMVEFGKENLSF